MVLFYRLMIVLLSFSVLSCKTVQEVSVNNQKTTRAPQSECVDPTSLLDPQTVLTYEDLARYRNTDIKEKAYPIAREFWKHITEDNVICVRTFL